MKAFNVEGKIALVTGANRGRAKFMPVPATPAHLTSLRPLIKTGLKQRCWMLPMPNISKI